VINRDKTAPEEKKGPPYKPGGPSLREETPKKIFLGNSKTSMMSMPHCKNMSLRRTNFKTLTSINEIFAISGAHLQHLAFNAGKHASATLLATEQPMI